MPARPRDWLESVDERRDYRRIRGPRQPGAPAPLIPEPGESGSGHPWLEDQRGFSAETAGQRGILLAPRVRAHDPGAGP
jgi:hypothetical protein